jgi:hypothetical protein
LNSSWDETGLRENAKQMKLLLWINQVVTMQQLFQQVVTMQQLFQHVAHIDLHDCLLVSRGGVRLSWSGGMG